MRRGRKGSSESGGGGRSVLQRRLRWHCSRGCWEESVAAQDSSPGSGGQNCAPGQAHPQGAAPHTAGLQHTDPPARPTAHLGEPQARMAVFPGKLREEGGASGDPGNAPRHPRLCHEDPRFTRAVENAAHVLSQPACTPRCSRKTVLFGDRGTGSLRRITESAVSRSLPVKAAGGPYSLPAPGGPLNS